MRKLSVSRASRADARRHIEREIDRLCEIIGLGPEDDEG
jgi:hypothetical protein